MYWLMRSASWPPVSVVSPRKSTGLSLFRFRPPTVRWPECTGWRSSSSVMTSRLERVTEMRNAETELPQASIRALSAEVQFRHPKTSAPRGLRGVVGHLLGEVGAPLDLLLDPRVVQRELVAFGNPAHLELDALSERAL